MPEMNTNQARVVDPILSNHARGYQNGEMISQVLFPDVIVPVRGGRVIQFGKEAFRRVNARRAPGSDVRRVTYGYASDPISVIQEALEGTVPVETAAEAAMVPGIDLGSGAVDMVMDIMLLNKECECSELALNAANYDANHKVALAGTDKWSDYANSDPIGDINAGREAIRSYIGRYPNTLTLGADVFNTLKEHPVIKDKIKYTSAKSITAEVLAGIFEIEKVVVGAAVALDEDAGDDEAANDVWGGAALLAFVPRLGQDYRKPSFGYNYMLPGMPMVETAYYENRAKSWIYPVTYERRPYLVGAEAGFLIQTPI